LLNTIESGKPEMLSHILKFLFLNVQLFLDANSTPYPRSPSFRTLNACPV